MCIIHDFEQYFVGSPPTGKYGTSHNFFPLLISFPSCRFRISIFWPFKGIDKSGHQGAKKVIFTACHSGKLKLAFTSPNVISTSPPNFWMSRIILISLFFFKLNSSKYFTCPSGKLRTEFTSPITKSTSLGLLDTTLFALWITGLSWLHTAISCSC